MRFTPFTPLAFLIVPLASAQDPLLPAVEITGLLTPRGRPVLADLDGDGLADAVALGRREDGPQRLYAARSTGGGAFAAPSVVQETPGAVRAFATGDIDGDGLVDVFLESFEAPGLRWDWLRGTGSGGFTLQPGASTAPLSVEGPQIHDIDGDGDGDIIANAEGGGVVWLENDAGDFTGAPRTLSPSGEGFQVLDMDSDGALDVLLGDEFLENGSAFSGILPGLGGGVFGPAATPIPVDSSPSVAVGDLDGDGLAELVYSRDLSMYLRAGTGSFTWGPEQLIGSVNLVRRIQRPLDLDADGNLDLRVQRLEILSTRALWLAGDGAGSFSAPALESADLSTEFSFGDADGDGRLDAIAALSYEVFLNRPSNPILPEPASQPFLSLLGGLVSLVSVDLDGDGDRDLVAAPLVGQDLVTIETLPGGLFGPVRPVGMGDGFFGSLAAGDFDGDGFVDIAATRAEGRIEIATGDGAGGLQFAGTTIDGEFRRRAFKRDPIRVDLDGDGQDELLGLEGDAAPALTWYQADSSGTFQPTSFGAATSFAAADLDNDGLNDVLALRPSGAVDWRRNLGAGQFAADAQLLMTSGATLIALADLDSDGQDDLVVDDAAQLLWARRLGGPSFDPLAPLASIPGAVFQNVDTGDITGDGALDLVVALRESGTNTVRILVGGGDGTIQSTLELESPGDTLSDVELSDLEGDGDVDLLTTGSLPIQFRESSLFGDVGANGCAAAVPNSTGAAGRLRAFGQVATDSTNLLLRADRLPPAQFGLVASSRTFGAPASLPGSAGVLCLTGNIGRYNLAGEIQQSSAQGTFELLLNPTALREGTGNAPAVAGESWTFQAWHRDVVGGGPTSNLTDSVTVTF